MLQTVNGKTMLTDKVYSAGKKLVQVIIPAASSAYFALGSIWGLPAVEKVVGTLAVVAVFIGACLGLSSSNFDASGAAHDGRMIVLPKTDGGLAYRLDLGDTDPADLQNKDSVSFKVVASSDPNATQGNPPSDTP